MQIDYNTVNKLKDLGFRVQPHGSRKGYTRESNGDIRRDWYNYEKEEWGYKGDHYFIPTIEEVIEELGAVELSVADNGYTVARKPNTDSNKEEWRVEDKNTLQAICNLYIEVKKEK